MLRSVLHPCTEPTYQSSEELNPWLDSHCVHFMSHYSQHKSKRSTISTEWERVDGGLKRCCPEVKVTNAGEYQEIVTEIKLLSLIPSSHISNFTFLKNTCPGRHIFMQPPRPWDEGNILIFPQQTPFKTAEHRRQWCFWCEHEAGSSAPQISHLSQFGKKLKAYLGPFRF